MDKAGDLLQEFFSRYNLTGGEKYVSLVSAWQKMAGDDIAAYSRIFDLRKDSLVVEVDHPGWMQILRMRQRDILDRISAAYPELGIRTIHVKLASGRQVSSPVLRQTEPEPVAEYSAMPRVSKTEKEALEAIHDEDLKNTLLRLKQALKKKRPRSS